ncbi:sodium:proton antiporter [Tistrella bauzanensis]|uniref:Sodium:proton antiporter n=1 Tax=Tistrella bauzanensis TaxID=657419 RepID=A0ABQ1IH02_9PROT|nr:YbaL family putative K(+) efflux transporter [Tistrella bauzanensis]GGB36095.1 sodium:proton antiporter [Tistrella bauzanensis]
MPHDLPLITTIVAGIGLAFILGAIAHRLRVSPLVGYLLAGVVIGPATPGYVADTTLVPQLAEIGVILLMFGVGLHFSVKDLLAVRAIALPGAIAQMGLATVMGLGLAVALDWGIGAGLIFGLALSVASTVVLLRALQDRRLVETERGRIAVGWLIVEDLAMVLVLVLLPAFAGLLSEGRGGAGLPLADLVATVAVTLGKVAVFVAVMLLAGRRIVPWILHQIAHSGSRELFRLCVLALALGVAYAASELFGASFALGAFFAGLVLSESTLSHRAAEETLPLRDAFAVLFFVSVGMLFDPAIIVDDPVPVMGALAIIVFGKSIAAYLIVRAFGHSRVTALTISASLAQIGEFSFILVALGVAEGLMPPEGRDVVLAGAILSILINPLLFRAIDVWTARTAPVLPPRSIEDARDLPPAPTRLSGHAVVVGYGRIGRRVCAALEAAAVPYLVIEDLPGRTADLARRGIETVHGNAATPDILAVANIAGASRLFVMISRSFEAGQVIAQALAANPGLSVVARAGDDDHAAYLRRHGPVEVVSDADEIARGMLDRSFRVLPLTEAGPASSA